MESDQADKPFQRLGSLSNAHAGSQFEAQVQAFFNSQGLRLSAKHAVDVGIGSTRKKRFFDLGCDEQKVLVECKSHRWTTGGNIPSAKMTVWNEAMLYFLAAPPGYRKILCVLRHHSEKRGVSLASYYVRIYRHLIPDDVEIWEFDDEKGTGIQVYPAP